MELQVTALLFLIGAIILGFVKKINVGLKIQLSPLVSNKRPVNGRETKINTAYIVKNNDPASGILRSVENEPIPVKIAESINPAKKAIIEIGRADFSIYRSTPLGSCAKA